MSWKSVEQEIKKQQGNVPNSGRCREIVHPTGSKIPVVDEAKTWKHIKDACHQAGLAKLKTENEVWAYLLRYAQKNGKKTKAT